MNIRVYTNAAGSEFIKAENDDYDQLNMLEDLTNKGFIFIRKMTISKKKKMKLS